MTEKVELFFPPDRRRAQNAVREMKRRLSRSFSHIMDRAEGHVPVDRDLYRELFRDLQGGARIKPELFGIYTDMLAAVADDDMSSLAGLFGELAGKSFRAGDLHIRAYGEAGFGPAGLKRYWRHAQVEEAAALFVTPDREKVRLYTASLR